MERTDLPSIAPHFLPLPIDLSHLSAVVNSINPDPACPQETTQLSNECARVNQKTTDAHPALSGTHPSRYFRVNLKPVTGRKHDPGGGRLIAVGQSDRLRANLAGVLEVFSNP